MVNWVDAKNWRKIWHVSEIARADESDDQEVEAVIEAG